MITIGYSTKNSTPEFQEYLRKSCGHPKIQIIEKVNNGEKNLSQTFNEIINESEFDIVVLCHDDIYFETNNWGQKLKKIFDRNTDFGIIGVAGTTDIPKSGMWWEDRSKMWGIVNHEHEGKKWESRYSDSLQNNVKEVILVDGLFTAINKNKIKKTYDESVPGFHMYDVNFCYRNFLENVKIGVITNIRVTHKSIGMVNEQWEKNRLSFSEKYSDYLPSKLKYDSNQELSILISNLSNLSSKLKGEKITNFNTKNPIGYKIGDGVFMVNTQSGVQKSQIGQYYKISEPKIDVIISSNLDEVRMCDSLYPNTLQVYNSVKNDENFKRILDYRNVKKIFKNDDDFSKNEIVDLLNDFKITKVNKIKIISGFSEKGGSTTAFINLTNSLNEHGYDCTFYGTHTWHLDKCKSSLIQHFSINSEDILICHFLDLPQRPLAKKVILSCHEKNLYKVGDKQKFWDTVVFLNEGHKNYHNKYEGDYTIIPNLKENLHPIEKQDKDNIAGIIGSIDENKQTHVSIRKAIQDGCDKIYIFGNVTDVPYYENYVKNLINDKVIFYGHHSNKQEMYNMIGRVYHSSISEVACLVKDECYLTNTKFFGTESTKTEVSLLTNDEVINKWIELLEI
jgi:hypothetical protein